MAFDVTALSAALGAYHREHTNDIFLRQLYNPLERKPGSPTHWLDIVRRNTFVDEQAFGRATFNIQVMESGTAVTEQTAASVILDGAIRKLRSIEHVDSMNPYALKKTWVAEMTDRAMRRKFRNTPELADVEFVPWLFDRMIAEFMRGFYLTTSFQGVYTAGFAYADSWAKAADGYLHIIEDLITAGTLTPVVTGAITSANAYDKLELMGQSLPADLMNKELYLLCSYQVLDWYRFDYTQTFPGQNPSIHPDYRLNVLRDRPNVMIIPVAEMGTSQRLIITPAENLEVNMNMKHEQGPELTFWPKNVKEIQYRLGMDAGFSIAVPADLLVNDQPPEA